MNVVEERKQKKEQDMTKKKALIDNIKTLKEKGYSDTLISKFLKIPLSTVRVYTNT